MANIHVDFQNVTGKIKPVHGVGSAPFYMVDYSMMHYLKQAHIPFSRLHDIAYPFGSGIYVDIPNIFRHFDADPEDPASYDFAFTDKLLTAMVENGVEPYFRLGVTIENYVAINAYRIYPPKDNLQWARICEGVIRHYTEGWADGFYYTMRYWEIWNEPDNFEESKMMENQMWRGTKEQFYALYAVAATHLKAKFPHLKIGGYGSCGFYALLGDSIAQALSTPRVQYFIDFFDGFLAYIKEHNAPLDFFSWHSYSGVKETKVYADYARKRLDEAGYTHTETSCNEWNFQPEQKGTAYHAAHNTAMLVMFQASPLDNAMFYHAGLGLSNYASMFHSMEKRPYKLYYGFKAFGELYALGDEAATASDNDEVYVCAATNGDKGGVLLVNLGEETELNLDLAGRTVKACRIIDEDKTYEEVALPRTIGKEAILYIETN